jgi:hypothetical protein
LCGAGAEAAVGHGQEYYRDQSFNDPGGEDQANAEATPFDQGVCDQMHFIQGITGELMDAKGQGAGCEGGKQHGLKLNSAKQGDWIDWGVGCRVSGVGYRVSGVGCRVSDVGYQVSGIRCRVLGMVRAKTWNLKPGTRNPIPIPYSLPPTPLPTPLETWTGAIAWAKAAPPSFQSFFEPHTGQSGSL